MSSIKTLLLTLSLFSVLSFLPGIAPIIVPSSFAADTKGTVLITGANRGIGLALAKRYHQAGYDVIATARKPAKAAELAALGVRIEQLDVSNPDSVGAMAKRLEGVPVDILINNAGVFGHDASSFAKLDIEQLDRVYNINSLGPLRVTLALLPNVIASKGKRVANISSQMGSMELNNWGCCLGYRASKAALNSFNKTLSLELGKQGLVMVVLHPGSVKTRLNESGSITVSESAKGLFNVISALESEDNGKFYDFKGKSLPW
jgi:NAD(P)-dependent dehydrogenase (short-subunit alcohol dehydrogenase family)